VFPSARSKESIIAGGLDIEDPEIEAMLLQTG
jgi:hypothetical protein